MNAPARQIDAQLRHGDRIGDRWLVAEPIGSGGHATVYRAEHETLGHEVAIKVLHLDRCGAALDEMLGRFRREARIAAQVQHENVVRVFDFGELEDGSPFFVMELVEGEDLQARIDRDGPLPIAAAVDVALQTLAGLAALADAGVVHRDVKPGNVMLQPREDGSYVAKLVDFGIAGLRDCARGEKFTIEGTVLGTPEYMSPEQIRGIELDSRADVWGLGVVLYEALCGELPFEGKGPCATLAMALTQEPPALRTKRADVPPALEAVVMRALVKDRNARWDSPLVMAVAISETARELGLATGAAAWCDAESIALRVVETCAAASAARPRSVRPLDIPGVVDGTTEVRGEREVSGTHRSSHKRPAARARFPRPESVRPPPLPAVARADDGVQPSDDHLLVDDGDATIDESTVAEHGSGRAPSTLTLKAQAQAVSPVLARVVIALVGLGLATALTLGLTEPEQLGAIEHEDLRGVQSVSVPPPAPVDTE